MIDFDNEVYTLVRNAVKQEYPDVYITNKSINAPTKFPSIAFRMFSNVVYNKTRDTSSNENHVAVAYQTDVFSNNKDNPVSECKKIMAIVDNVLLDYGFSRNFYEPIDMPVADTSITRFTARHRAVFDKNGTIYRR